MVTRFERFWSSIMVVSRHLHKIAASEMEKYGLSGPHAFYLLSLYRHPDGITSAKLSQICEKDRADVSRALSLMEKRGLVSKQGGTSGYRAKIRLTESGCRAAETLREKAAMAVELADKGVDPTDRDAMYRVIETISANLKLITECGLP